MSLTTLSTEQTKNEQLILRTREYPIIFVNELLGIKQLWSGEEDILTALSQFDFITVKSGHALGKDFCAALAIIWFMIAYPPAVVIVTSTTERQVQEIVWAELEAAIRGAPIELGGNLTSEKWEISPKHYALGFTTKETNEKVGKLQGFHAPNILVIVSEAQAVEDRVYKQIEEGLLTSKNSKLLLIGNPLHLSGRFYESFTKPGYSEKFHHITLNCEDAIKWQEQYGEIPGLVSDKWIKDLATEYGRQSNEYACRVLGEFPEEDADTLIPARLIDEASKRKIDILEGEPRIISCDVARYGGAKTVVFSRHGHKLYRCDVMDKSSITQVVNLIKRVYQEEKGDYIVIDDDGVGGGVVDMLTDQRFPVLAFKGGWRQEAMDVEKFANLRSQIYFYLKKRFDVGDYQIDLPDIELGHLRSELSSIRLKPDALNRIKIESKEDMRARQLSHFDYADCYDEETEILTKTGWKYFENLTPNDIVFSIDPITEYADYYPIQQIIKQKYAGKMLFFENRGLNFCVTPNHKMLVNKRPYYYLNNKKCYQWRLSTIKDIKQQNFMVKKVCYWNGKVSFEKFNFVSVSSGKGRPPKSYSFNIKDWFEFLGWYLSEGNAFQKKKVGTYWIQISQSFEKNKDNCNRIEKLFEKMGIKASKQHHAYIFGSRMIAQELMKYGKGAVNKRIPDYIKNASPELIKIFLDAFCLGDGYKTPTSRKFSTSSKLLADDLQELVLKTGKYATIQKIKLAGTKKFIVDHWAEIRHDHYIISEYAKSEGKDSFISKKDIEDIYYDGNVYCVTTEPYHTVMVRRNGRPLWSGNSFMMSEYAYFFHTKRPAMVPQRWI